MKYRTEPTLAKVLLHEWEQAAEMGWSRRLTIHESKTVLAALLNAHKTLDEAVELLTPGQHRAWGWQQDEWELRRINVLRRAGKAEIADELAREGADKAHANYQPDRAAKYEALLSDAEPTK